MDAIPRLDRTDGVAAIVRSNVVDSLNVLTCQSSYDRVADEYVARIFDELKGKPLDRQLLDRFADEVREWHRL